MTLPTWLIDVLDRGLPMLRGRERDELAEMIVEALPKQVILEAIASSTKATLERRTIRDGAGDLSRDIAENAAQTVIALLSVGEDLDECADCGASTAVGTPDPHVCEVRHGT